jgi:hypothetical protein
MPRRHRLSRAHEGAHAACRPLRTNSQRGASSRPSTRPYLRSARRSSQMLPRKESIGLMLEMEKRARLREALTQLVNGVITNDQFCNLALGSESADRAVQTIGEFFAELSTDDREYRFTGPDALAAEDRAVAKRCCLFLQTDREYEWPEAPSTFLQAAAGGVAVFLMLPLGVVLLIAAIALRELGLAVGAIASFGLGGFLFWCWWRRKDTPAWRAYWASGERDYWPFLHRAEYEQALHGIAQPEGSANQTHRPQ